MVRLNENKFYTEHHALEQFPLPQRVYIPLSQHIGKPAVPVVNVGDQVCLGQRIATADAAVTSIMHASVSGKVVAIQDWPHPVQGIHKAIVIENDGTDQLPPEAGCLSSRQIEELSVEAIRNMVCEAGIVGMGGAGFPTHIKLTPPRPVDTLILNGAECEPYLTGDFRLMVEKTQEIIKGIGLIVRATGLKQVYIAIEDNKPEAIEAFKDRARGTGYGVKVLKSEYPQGGEKQLIKNVLGREVPSGKLPFDVGVLVQNVGTTFAIYEAVYKRKPLYERVVCVTGDCLASPKNLVVRIGTPIQELIEFCQPSKHVPVKIVSGGPMMGIAQYDQRVPITKTSSAVVLLSKKAVQLYREDPCVRCGECVRSCPSGLEPCMISLAAQQKRWDLAKIYSPSDCIECGICSYICPAKRNIVQSIKYAKGMMQ